MKPIIHTAIALFVLLLSSGPALAKNYTLANGRIAFNAPDAWPAIMEKTSGQRQFYAFQIRNPKASGTLTRITVTTLEMQSPTDFDAFVQQQTARARQSAGFSEAAGKLAGEHTLHYHFDEDKHPQVVRLHLIQHGTHAVILRCQRPRDARATRQWLAAYRDGCADLARQLGN